MMKKVIAFILVAVLIAFLIPNISNTAFAATTLTETQFASKIAALQKEYPDGKYWSNKNGTVSSGTYKGTSLVGDKTCSSSYGWSSNCGTFALSGTVKAWQCHGFALLLAHKIFGSNANNWSKYTSTSRKIYAGDVIRVDADGDGVSEETDHTIFVYKVTSTYIYYADCNQTKPCQINWDKMTLTSLRKKLLYVRHLTDNTLTGSGTDTPVLSVKFHANGGTILNSDITGYTYKVTDSAGLNLRKGAGTSYDTIVTLSQNTTFNVNVGDTKTANGYTWGKTTVGGNTGWAVISDFVSKTATLRTKKYYISSSLVYKSSSSSAFVQSMVYGETYENGLANATSFDLTREGHTFVGWSLTADGSTTIFDQNDATVKGEHIYPDLKNGSKTVTMYAIWQANTPATLTFAYDANGGDGIMSTVTATAGGNLTLADNQFVRSGYSFQGWQLQRQDGQWYTELSNWATEDTMAAQGYSKKLFAPGDTLTLDSTLVKLSNDHAYTLHAVWRDDSVQNIYVSKIGNDDLYYVGDSLNTTDLRLMVQYTDGTCETVTEGFTCTPTVLSKEGKQNVQVQYNDLTTDYQVTVTAAKAWKQNATAKAKTTAYLLPSTSAKTFYYASKDDELTILCKDGSFYLGFYPWLTSDITQANGMLVYIPTSGVTLNSGVTVPNAADFYTINRNGTMKNDAAVYHRTNTTAANTNGTDVTKLGTLKQGASVKVLFEMNNYYCVQTSSYTGFVAKASIQLNPIVCGIYVDVTSGVDRLEVAPGETIDTTNLYVAAIRSDGTAFKVDAEVQVPNTETAGRKYMIITYEGYTTFVPVDVVEKTISQIYVYTPPIQQNYNKYETLDPAGMSIAVVYEDGTEEILTDGFLIGEHDFTEPGYVMVELEYKGYTTQYTALAYSLVTLNLDGAVGYHGETVSVPMSISCATEELHIYSYETELHYNPQQLAYQGFKEKDGVSQENVEGAVLTVTPMDGGVLKVVYTSETPIPLNEILVTFDFQVVGEISEETEENEYVIMPESVAFYDYSRLPLFSTCSYSTVINLGDAEQVVQPTLTLKAPALEFRDMITVNAFYTAENIEDVVEMGMITYTEKVDVIDIKTAAHVIPGASYDESTGRYFSSSQGIHAKYLGDTVYLACYAKLTNGSYVYTKLAPYSPITYATNQLKNSTNTQLKQLVAAMLNYGAAAQNYFGYNTDILANASLSEDQKQLPEAYTSDMVSTVPAANAAKQGIFANNKGFSLRKPAVSFEGAFSINYFFTPAYAPVDGITLYYWTETDFDAVDELTAENATGSVAMEGEGTSQYRGDITGISAKDLSKAVYVAAVYSDGTTTWTSGVLGYSIGAYCSSMAKGTGTMADLAMATAVYGHHAKQYFG